MAHTAVIGMQWGDEGKGKIVDLLCPAFDAVVRFQGGNNAGHTVRFGEHHFALHLIPSGILRPGMLCVLGNGMVISPEALFDELDRLEAAGIESTGRLFVSRRAHLILPLHIELDRAREASMGSGKIGTTARGIGPAYEAKASRFGLRAGDLFASDFDHRLAAEHERISTELAHLGAAAPGLAEISAACASWRPRLEPMLRDSEYLLDRWMKEGKCVLFEGAQGTLLDLDHGTYPFVTSSSASAGGACTGAGVAPSRLEGVLGVLKAYTTRVGSGPFVSELTDDSGEFLRQRGNEFGTTTGRPRRCGWFDAVVARHSRLINGVDAIALTKLDVLDTLEEIRVCVGYRLGELLTRDLPSSLDDWARAEPVYLDLPGWQQSTEGILDFESLPENAQDYVRTLEREVGAPVAVISTGPRREETMLRSGQGLERLTSDRLAS
jgi:adenylosuccinate synthase